MKISPVDPILAEVHAAKDALSREANYNVARLISASRTRAQAAPLPRQGESQRKNTP